ncbi:MAG: hypothetical protein HQK53_09830 [Oligoflexia bacterium]|nr:hypothetical protein [Oligoflexia bacterium]
MTICGAHTRGGELCTVVSIPGKKRCRYHGGLSSGPKTLKGKANSARNAFKHGLRSKMATRFRKMRVAHRGADKCCYRSLLSLANKLNSMEDTIMTAIEEFYAELSDAQKVMMYEFCVSLANNSKKNILLINKLIPRSMDSRIS